MKLKTLEDLNTLKAEHQVLLQNRRTDHPISIADAQGLPRQVMVCGGTGCHASDSPEIVDEFQKELKRRGLSEQIHVLQTGCFGFCEKGPILEVHPDNVLYLEVSPKDVPDIIEEHFVQGKPLERLLYKDPNTEKPIISDLPFYHSQMRIALRNCSLISPEDIKEYIAVDGYQALSKVLFEMTPETVVDVIKKSGLRGRGGGGFPTGVKWELARNNEANQRYIICNADEGDPGAFMDRSILEGDPHTVLEAMLIAGYTIGSSHGFIYIRAEYPLAIHRLETAIKQAKQYGLLGKEILGSTFCFDIEIKYGAGAFVCGEETALIHSIEGARGEPSVKPPFPAEQGLWGKPTCVNNVETLANIPPIILKGAEWYAGIGTEKSKGTKVFALAGKVNNVGLVEVPMGTTLRQIIFDIGGGIKHHKTFKAAQTGGPSGGCIPTKYLDTPIDYESLIAIGSMMGSGGLIVMDESDCMVNIAKFYLEFTVDESCGRCTACRVGTKRLHEILTKITEGKGNLDDLDQLVKLGKTIKDSSLCGLGQSAPNPVLSTIEYFRDEYIAHIVDKTCPAGVCKSLLKFDITDKCKGCTLCAKNCPAGCITGTPKELHSIDQERCLKCGACLENCRFDAIIRH
ncbi:NADH:ubiquinone oxidoreductase, NADH-binding (51 kD) subunit [Desulfosporosinus acidiphilus SJ4]|uniref:NADH:ubiquinone oxidoreductase, NADH-binding (51 kD) subunit n=1 Tax=Desulfosporosinus acidiphilus (strain DSM 22704 / JCM 16185 / SJ4) TaxID=646529 RepID=I4DBY7_DESAJ|nr:NADH-quinone oxidoreductase subunit NuoF [Desulfosporosinus acidiphilus]AFM43311.1 NADH:ubiquinone oxidoreductase, NADH-binding (51 kD) subunit [Desulfosporosinus acidiphilus SJ4]